MRDHDVQRPKVLCVDDEPQILDGLVHHLRRRFEVVTATSRAEGLQYIANEGPFAFVLSVMRMPIMDGAVFLSRVSRRSKSVSRLEPS